MANAHDLLMAQRAAMMGGKPLPYDAEVEWIGTDERNKEKYLIDTLFTPTIKSKVELVVSSNLTGWQYNGCGNTDATRFCFRSNTLTQVVLLCGNKSRTVNYTGFGTFGIDAKNGLFIANGSQTSFDTSGFTGGLRSFLLFAIRNNNNYIDYPSDQKLKSFRAWDDDVLVLDLIAVRFTNENGDSEGAMYDRVSGRLFRNSGTGAFAIGPDKT